MLEHLGVADALDRGRAVQLDLALAIVLDALRLLQGAHLDKDEGDLAALVFKINVHVLCAELFSNGVLDLFVAF